MYYIDFKLIFIYVFFFSLSKIINFIINVCKHTKCEISRVRVERNSERVRLWTTFLIVSRTDLNGSKRVDCAARGRPETAKVRI